MTTAQRSTTMTALTQLGPEGALGEGGPCQLVVIDGPQMGCALLMGQGAVVVGHDPGCDLVLQDARVSRRHVQLEAAPGGYKVQDLGSRNGTFYEGSRVEQALLPPGAVLKVGRTLLKLQPQPRALALEPSQARQFGELVAESLAMRQVFALLELVAPGDSTLLIGGESGTGKELVARAVHAHSARRGGPMVVLDCGALPEALLESELFGHVKGAFTGAQSAREGAFVRADGGTIFLDELGKLSLAAQARLLRVLEEGTLRPVGGDAPVRVDVRVLGASCEPLERLVAEGLFRPDLYYRLAVIQVTLPPLRERREDIPAIVAALLPWPGQQAQRLGGANLQALMAHDWPGNVRELRNIIERAVVLSPRATCFEELRLFGLEPARVPPAPGAGGTRADLPFGQAKQLVLERFEREYLGDLMARCEGNISQAARQAQLDRKHLRELLRRHGLLA